MDLANVLTCGTDGLGHPVLARYYADLFARHLPAPEYEGAFRVRAALNFGVQQLATRSRVSPQTERYAQIGGFGAHDLPAALIEAMPHTIVACADPPPGCQAALSSLRDLLPVDALPHCVVMADAVLPPASFGLVAVFAAEDVLDIGPWRALLNPSGRVLLIRRQAAGTFPAMSLHA